MSRRGVVEIATPAELERFPRPDPAAGFLAVMLGKKHSGKSVAARLIYRRIMTDKLCIDPTGDADPGPGAELVRLDDAEPWFAGDEPVNLLFRVHVGAPSWREDMDAAIGRALADRSRPCTVWVDEAGLLAPSPTSTLPNMRTLLMALRHYGPTSAILCSPRAKGIDPLVLLQADLVFIYRLPSRMDRLRVAENIGCPLDVFERAHAEMVARGDFWFLLWDARGNQLWLCPPLPV